MKVFSVDPRPAASSLSDMPEGYRIGIDLGGTKTEVILLDPSGRTLLRKRRPTPRDDGYSAICQVICELVDEARALLPEQSFSIGLGIPGILDPSSGLVVNANTTILIGRPLRADLEQRLGQRIAIENDANCFILAEATSGAAVGADSAFGIIMGTGCGGGIYLNGSVRKGRHGIAGEWGHFSVDPSGPLCWCGNHGCIETLISGTGLETRYRQITESILTAPEIITAARLHDPVAESLLDQFLEDFGRCLGGLISILDPDIVVIGGGLSHIDELYTTGVERMKRYAFHPDLSTSVVRNQLGDSAGVFGAAFLTLAK